MMLALLAAAVLVALPGLTDRLGRRLAPQEWARLCGIGLGAGFGLFELAAVLRAAPPVLRAAGVPLLAAACERMLGPLLAGGATASWVAAVAAFLLPASAAVVWLRGRRVRRRVASELWLGERTVIAGHEVVVLPIGRPFAVSFAAAANDETVVVSGGLLECLDGRQAAAVVRHEVAHLRLRHQRLLEVAAVVEGVVGWLPPVARSVGALRLAVERAADEEASSAAPGARHDVRESLLILAGLSSVSGVAAFADARTVAARIAALAASPAPPGAGLHTLLYTPGTAAGLVAAPALLSWGGHLQMVVAMAGRCAA